MLKTLIIAVCILFIAILFMGVKVFFTKGKEFPSYHISDSKAMKQRGINCATSQDKELRTRTSPIKELLKSDEYNYLQ